MEYLSESEQEEEKQEDARPSNNRSIVLERSRESVDDTSFTPSNH